MSAHTCEAVVVHCIDFRLQQFLNDWLKNRFGKQNYDRISWAGGVKDFIYLQHDDCGAYGPTGTKERYGSDLGYAGE